MSQTYRITPIFRINADGQTWKSLNKGGRSIFLTEFLFHNVYRVLVTEGWNKMVW